MPKSTVTGVLPWLQEHKDVHVTFASRMRVTRAVTQEALMFAMAHSYLAVDGAGAHQAVAQHLDEADLLVVQAACVAGLPDGLDAGVQPCVARGFVVLGLRQVHAHAREERLGEFRADEDALKRW